MLVYFRALMDEFVMLSEVIRSEESRTLTKVIGNFKDEMLHSATPPFSITVSMEFIAPSSLFRQRFPQHILQLIKPLSGEG
jgi:hypothetical protein